MKKIFFLCLSLFLISTCKKSTPTSPSPSTKTPPIVSSFNVNPTQIDYGQSANLSWNVSGASSISIDQGIGSVSSSGSRSVSPTETTTYTLIAVNNDGQTTKSCTLTVNKIANVVMTAGPIYEETDWSFTYKGILKNIGNADAEWVKIYIYIYKTNGDLVTYEYNYADDYILTPGESSAWDVMFWDDGKAIRKQMDKSKTTYEIKWD